MNAMTREELVAAAIRVCTEVVRTGGSASTTLPDAQAVVAELVQQAVAAGALAEPVDQAAHKRALGRHRSRKWRDEQRKRNASVTPDDTPQSRTGDAPRRHRDAKQRYDSVTGDAAVRHAPPSDSPFSDQDPASSSPKTLKAEEEESDARASAPRNAQRVTERHDHDPVSRETRVLVGELAKAWNGCGLVQTGGLDRDRLQRAVPVLQHLAGELCREPLELWRLAVAAFKADEQTLARHKCTLPVLCAQLEQWARAGLQQQATSTPALGATRAERIARLRAERRAALERKQAAQTQREREDADAAVSQAESALVSLGVLNFDGRGGDA